MKIPKIVHLPFTHVNCVKLPLGFNRSGEITRTFTFTEESKYETKDLGNQMDWNKLFGLTPAPGLNARKDSVMWAWRYYNGKFQISYYYHDQTGKAYYTIIDPFEVPMGEPVTLTIRVEEDNDRVNFTARVNRLIRSYNEPRFMSSPKKGLGYRIINAWFGGTETPDRVVKIY